MENATSELPRLSAAVEGCACPDCGMPMAIRAWLGVAECGRCGTSIALEYVVREAAPPVVVAPRPAVAPTTFVAERVNVGAKPPAAVTVVAPPVDRRRKKFWRQLHELLSCLASAIAHLLLLILLALASMDREDWLDDTINLSVEISPLQREGGRIDDQVQKVGFELPREPAPAETEAEQWAKELQLAPDEPAPHLPALSQVADSLNSDDKYRRMLSARDPRIRREVIEQEGGTNVTEAAVARALRWMAQHQHEDGSWSLDKFHHAADCDCDGRASLHSDTGATALVLQAMLGAGQTHRSGLYRDQVSHALQFLLAEQDDDGDLRSDSAQQTGMYVHALGTIALCDAYALTGDETLRDPAQRAIDFVTESQHRRGGWRYTPNQPGDLSVTGWQLMALHSGRAGGLNVSSRTLVDASRYLDSVQTDRRGSQYAYQEGNGPTPAMTAEGLLSRMYLGSRRNDRGMAEGVDWLISEHPPSVHDTNVYYWYYATQVMHHWGGRPWREWNRQMRDVLVATQVRRGHAAGSWDPRDPHGGQGGRLYMTVLACCTLEVYYRHAPLYRKIELAPR